MRRARTSMVAGRKIRRSCPSLAPDRLAPKPRRATLVARQNLWPRAARFGRGFTLFPARSPMRRTMTDGDLQGKCDSQLHPGTDKHHPLCRTRRTASDAVVKCCTRLAQKPASPSRGGIQGIAAAAANATPPGRNKRTAAKASHTIIFPAQFRAARPRDGRPYYDPLRRLPEE